MPGGRVGDGWGRLGLGSVSRPSDGPASLPHAADNHYLLNHDHSTLGSGWRFDAGGKCVEIPQLKGDATAHATACGSARTCVKTFPVQVRRRMRACALAGWCARGVPAVGAACMGWQPMAVEAWKLPCAHAGARACAAHGPAPVHPCPPAQEKGGLLWVWPDAGPTAAAEAAAAGAGA